MQVNNNGIISFNEPFSRFVGESFPINDSELIAPFWADADTRPLDGGFVWYRETNDPELLARARRDVQLVFPRLDTFLPSSLFIATWDHVGYYDHQTDRVSLLLVKKKTFRICWVHG